MATIEMLPDVEELLVAWMTTDPDVSALLGDRVSTRRPGKEGVFPLGWVLRAGGTQPEWWEELARVQVSVYAADSPTGELDAAHIAQVIAAASVRLCGTSWDLTHGRAYVSSAECAAAPLSGFDPETGRPFYHLDLLVQTHPGETP